MTLEQRGVAGTVAPGYERVRDAFAETLSMREPGTGSAFAAVVDTQLVVDLWGGEANPAGTPWQEDTVCVIFSGTKGVVATALLVLVDQGWMRLTDRVCDHWPAFAGGGKTDVTVAQLASHAGGLPYMTEAMGAADLSDIEALAESLARQSPVVEVGTPTYHAITWGWLCDGLIRHVDGRSAAVLVRDELAIRHGLDLRIGLDGDAAAATRMARLRRSAGYRPSAFAVDEPDPRLQLVYAAPWEAIESDIWLEQPVPAANGIATARAMATMYGALVTGTVVGLDVLTRGVTVTAEGHDPLTGRHLRFGPTGYELWGTPSRLGPSQDAFGHTGSGGSSHGAWPAYRCGFSYVTSELRAEADDARAELLLEALHAAVRSG